MNKDQIIETVKRHMESIKLEYDSDIGVKCRDKELEVVRDNSKKEVYVVSFKTPDSAVEYNNKGELISLIEGYPCWCYIDANTYEILYYIKPHGYIEVDGTGHWV